MSPRSLSNFASVSIGLALLAVLANPGWLNSCGPSCGHWCLREFWSKHVGGGQKKRETVEKLAEKLACQFLWFVSFLYFTWFSSIFEKPRNLQNRESVEKLARCFGGFWGCLRFCMLVGSDVSMLVCFWGLRFGFWDSAGSVCAPSQRCQMTPHQK